MATKPTPDEIIQASEVVRKFGQIQNDLIRGKSFTITRAGQPIGRIIPFEPPPAKSKP